ncbi:MAG: hypothetical protein ABI653_08465, partial [Bacteroidota bacterium]
ILTCTFIFLNIFRLKRREYILFVSGGIAALSIEMAVQRFPLILNKKDEKTIHFQRPASVMGFA